MEPICLWDMPDDPHGNVVHIQEHGISVDDVEDVIYNRDNETGTSNSSGEPCTFGWTQTGLHIMVVWEHVCDDPRTIRPITAYEVAPRRKGRRR